MKEVSLQYKNKALYPYSEEDLEELRSFKQNQVLTAKIKGVSDPVSLQQYGMWWGCCNLVAENTEDPEWNTKEKVCEQVKLAIKHVDFYVISNEIVHAKTKSISRASIKKFEMSGKMDEGLQVMADKLGITVQELTREVKQ